MYDLTCGIYRNSYTMTINLICVCWLLTSFVYQWYLRVCLPACILITAHSNVTQSTHLPPLNCTNSITKTNSQLALRDCVDDF